MVGGGGKGQGTGRDASGSRAHATALHHERPASAIAESINKVLFLSWKKERFIIEEKEWLVARVTVKAASEC